MNAELRSNRLGGYRFLQGIEPYSSGVVAESGFEIVHATLARAMPWHEGMIAARKYLEGIGRPRQAMCAVELRCPVPFTMDGFIDFNRGYRALLEDWEMLVDGDNPVARTNVAPVFDPPAESLLYAFSYTIPCHAERSTFVVAGGGELRGALAIENIIERGNVTEAGMRKKVDCVLDIMNERLQALGDSDDLSCIDVYTHFPLPQSLQQVIADQLPIAARIGVHWFMTRPPIEEIEFEMDMRGVASELVVTI